MQISLSTCDICATFWFVKRTDFILHARILSHHAPLKITKSKYNLQCLNLKVVPLHKTNDPLDKEIYRPVSVLPIISKAFERVMHNQLSEHFNELFNPYLAAFRKGFGCRSTLLRLIEDWRVTFAELCLGWSDYLVIVYQQGCTMLPPNVTWFELYMA